MDKNFCNWYMFEHVLNSGGHVPLEQLLRLRCFEHTVVKEIKEGLLSRSIQEEYGTTIEGIPNYSWAEHIVTQIKTREAQTLLYVPRMTDNEVYPDTSFIALAGILKGRGDIISVWDDWRILLDWYTGRPGGLRDKSGAGERIRRVTVASQHIHPDISLQSSLDWILEIVVGVFDSFEAVMQLCADLPPRLKNLLYSSRTVSMNTWLGLYDRQRTTTT